MKRLFIFSVICLLLSCATTKETPLERRMNQYMGWSKRDILIHWGEPVRDGYVDGVGKVLAFTRYKRGAFGNDYYENTVFFLNTDYKVEGWRVTNDPVPVDRLDIRVWRF